MPIHSRASGRYARALLMAADKAGGEDSLEDQVRGLRDLLDQSPALRDFLSNPTVAKENKLATVERLFKGKVSPLVWRFLALLVEKYREGMLPEILEALVAMLDDRAGVVHAEVASAVPLAPGQEDRLKSKLVELTSKDVVVHLREDESIVTGFIAQVGDTVFDASLDAQLGRLRDNLMGAALQAGAKSGEE
jgi:F-type H+-transporting ATPase subunit delta